MAYEWDEQKRQANLAKHGLDFADADKVYAARRVLRIGSPRVTPFGVERRTVSLARVRIENTTVTLTLVTVERDGNLRVISFRRASEDERQALAQAFGVK